MQRVAWPLFGTQTTTELGRSPESFWTHLGIADNPFLPGGNYQEICNRSNRDWDMMACVPIIFMLGCDIVPCLERAFLYGIKCRSPQLGVPGHGQGWAALGGWVEEERLVFCTLAHHKHGSQGKGSPTWLPVLCSTAGRKGQVRIWPLAASICCPFQQCLGLVQLLPSPSKPFHGGSATCTGSAFTPDRSQGPASMAYPSCGEPKRLANRGVFAIVTFLQ